MTDLRLTIFCLVVLCAGACLRIEPRMVDRHSQLEKQILGELQRLESELILSSSVRGDTPAADKPVSNSEHAARAAALSRAFNADDLEALKANQSVGEAANGELELLQRPRGAAAAQRARLLVAQENRDRLVVWRHALLRTPALSEKDLPLVRMLFHRLMLARARPGDRVQRQDGGWTTVEAPATDNQAPSQEGSRSAR